MNPTHIFYKRHSLFLNAGIVVAGTILLKMIFHLFGWEVLSANPLLSGIVGATVFLMGFLLSGVMSDYKESEKLPGDLASSIESLVDEAVIIHRSKDEKMGKTYLESLLAFSLSLEAWFHKKRKTRELMEELRNMSRFFTDFEAITQANFIARLKQEQSMLRKILIRIHTIRETSFIPSGYLIAMTTTGLLLFGLILVKMDPFYESLFFVGVIAFLLSFLLLLIRDLDNPFGYYESGSMEEISLTPLKDVITRLQSLLESVELATGQADGRP